MGELSRYRGEGSGLGLPDQGRALLGKVVVASATPAGALAVGAAGVAAWQSLGIPNGNVPGVITHIPLIGHPITDALVWAGNGLGSVESVHVLGVSPVAVGLAGGVGFVAYKKLGKPFQEAMKRVVRRNGLSG